jgi:hypothetical protein
MDETEKINNNAIPLQFPVLRANEALTVELVIPDDSRQNVATDGGRFDTNHAYSLDKWHHIAVAHGKNSRPFCFPGQTGGTVRYQWDMVSAPEGARWKFADPTQPASRLAVTEAGA